MIRLADLVHQHRRELLSQYADQLLPSHHRALDAIEQCRTLCIGTSTWQCDECNHTRLAPLSCGHRNCPTCQNNESSQWLQRETDKLIPTNYFLLTFTVPAQLRNTVYQHQRSMYSLLFQSAVNTIKQFAQQSERLNGKTGMTAVLHTHNRRMDFHPHIHVLIPALALNTSTNVIRQTGGKYLFNVKSLATVFRAKCLDAVSGHNSKAECNDKISLPVGVPGVWNVHSKPVGRGEPTLKYLARYLYRGVISEKQILSVNDGKVLFEYLCSDTKTMKTRELSVTTFLWKILMHVLPGGFQRARCYGLLHHSASLLLKRIQLKLHVKLIDRTKESTKKIKVKCPKCKSSMSCIQVCRPKRSKHSVCPGRERPD